MVDINISCIIINKADPKGSTMVQVHGTYDNFS